MTFLFARNCETFFFVGSISQKCSWKGAFNDWMFKLCANLSMYCTLLYKAVALTPQPKMYRVSHKNHKSNQEHANVPPDCCTSEAKNSWAKGFCKSAAQIRGHRITIVLERLPSKSRLHTTWKCQCIKNVPQKHPKSSYIIYDWIHILCPVLIL